MSAPTYGGQAVIEGVMIRGRGAMAVAVRSPDGSILTRAERLGALNTGTLRRMPLVRGILVLSETMALGFRALRWASAVAAAELDERGEPRRLATSARVATLLSLAVTVAFFFVAPTAATVWLDGIVGAPWISVLIEGALRLALLVGYIWLIGRSSEIARVFQYHGAEHMTIRAFEDGRELRVPVIRRYEKEHPRCGTSFLLTVALIAALVFVFIGDAPLWWRFASRIVLIPVIAAVAYEVIRFGGSHSDAPFVRLLFAGNLALQRLTTRVPDDEQIQVAIASLERVRAEEEAILAGR